MLYCLVFNKISSTKNEIEPLKKSIRQEQNTEIKHTDTHTHIHTHCILKTLECPKQQEVDKY